MLIKKLNTSIAYININILHIDCKIKINSSLIFDEIIHFELMSTKIFMKM